MFCCIKEAFQGDHTYLVASTMAPSVILGSINVYFSQVRLLCVRIGLYRIHMILVAKCQVFFCIDLIHISSIPSHTMVFFFFFHIEKLELESTFLSSYSSISFQQNFLGKIFIIIFSKFSPALISAHLGFLHHHCYWAKNFS
jgi:hypothetical protein